MPTDMIETDVPATCRDCTVRLEGMCATLTGDELRQLAESARHVSFEVGDPLVVEDSDLTTYANVTDGVVKLSRVLRNGRQQVVGLHFSPDLLGRLFGTENRLTAEAASQVSVCRVPKDALETLVSSNPELKRRLLDQSLQDLDDARDWLVTLGRKDAQQRVASLLLHIARRAGASEFELPLSRTDMADFLGLTVETVCRQISKLRREDVVRIVNHRHVTVPDMPRLTQRAG